MSGNYVSPEGVGMADVNLAHYANHVSCMLCHSSIKTSEAIPLASLSDSQRGLVLLSGMQTELDPFVCTLCLSTLSNEKNNVTGYLNSFSHFSSYSEVIQGIGRAYFGVLIICNLFQSTNILPAVIGAVFFAMCSWSELAEIFIKIMSFPPFLLTALFIPWTVIVYFGTNPFSLARLLNDPGQYIPWTTFTFFHENYITGVFIGAIVVVVL